MFVGSTTGAEVVEVACTDDVYDVARCEEGVAEGIAKVVGVLQRESYVLSITFSASMPQCDVHISPI